MAVEDANGEVLGPAATVREALQLLGTAKVHAAILDANLPDGDVTPVAEELIARGIPIIINTGVALPFKLMGHSDLPVQEAYRPYVPHSRTGGAGALLFLRRSSNPAEPLWPEYTAWQCRPKLGHRERA